MDKWRVKQYKKDGYQYFPRLIDARKYCDDFPIYGGYTIEKLVKGTYQTYEIRIYC